MAEEKKRVFVPDFNTRSKKRGRPGPNSPVHALTAKAAMQQPAPASPVPIIMGKTAAMEKVKDSGLDPKAFEEVLAGWLETGAIVKDKNTYVIPETMVDQHIALKADSKPAGGEGDKKGDGDE